MAPEFEATTPLFTAPCSIYGADQLKLYVDDGKVVIDIEEGGMCSAVHLDRDTAIKLALALRDAAESAL